MPHLILHLSPNALSGNAVECTKLQELLDALHGKIAATDTFDRTSIKSRAITCPNFIVDESNSGKEFLHIELKIMEGRSKELKNQLIQALVRLAAESLN